MPPKLQLPFAAITRGPSFTKSDKVAPLSDLLGEGQFAEVYSTVDRGHAVKAEKRNSKAARAKFDDEIEILSKLGEHENIVSYVGCYIEDVK